MYFTGRLKVWELCDHCEVQEKGKCQDCMALVFAFVLRLGFGSDLILHVF